jgi:hypothetical protein
VAIMAASSVSRPTSTPRTYTRPEPGVASSRGTNWGICPTRAANRPAHDLTMSITQPMSHQLTQPISVDGGPPSTGPTTSGRWERAMVAAASSLATVAFAFGAPIHPRLFSRHVETREGS